MLPNKRAVGEVQCAMEATTRLVYLRDVARASSERDKCIRALGLEPSKRSDPWSILDATATERTEEIEASNNKRPASPANNDGNKDEEDSGMPTRVTSHSDQTGASSPVV